MSDRVSALLTDGAERPGRARFPIFVQLLATVIGTIAMVLTVTVMLWVFAQTRSVRREIVTAIEQRQRELLNRH